MENRRITRQHRCIERGTGIVRLLAVSLFLLFMYACIDEYWPEINAYQNLLVVDGMITNGQGPFQVDLSLSTRVDVPAYEPYGGCAVSIVDDAGGSIELLETSTGTYRSSDEAEGIIGRSYKLMIETPSGKQYSSEFDELTAPALIDSVYPVLENKIDPAYDYELSGYQFYLDSKTNKEMIKLRLVTDLRLLSVVLDLGIALDPRIVLDPRRNLRNRAYLHRIIEAR